MDQSQFGPWPEWITMSYAAVVGQPLCAPEQLYGWHGVVLCHGTSDDPSLVHANLAAQTLWEQAWPDFVGMPSRLIAPADQRADALSSSGLVRGNSPVRVSRSGRRFRILDATVWPVVDRAGAVSGQAATFTRAEPMEG